MFAYGAAYCGRSRLSRRYNGTLFRYCGRSCLCRRNSGTGFRYIKKEAAQSIAL
jgi:hypothetical protein